ncbi:hypothetical protein [Chitinivorax sp. B]|uniref:hypothetical protein n=1 Tax=Chitinivorax sp. B TaxID=2502235 RepID=UPI0010F5104F|nr:hypothetical protein [Chitinivorax sp. B]
MKLRCCLCGMLLGAVSIPVAGAPVGCNPLIEPVELRGEESPRSIPVFIPRDMVARLPGFMVQPLITPNNLPEPGLGSSYLPHIESAGSSADVVTDAHPYSGQSDNPLSMVGIKLVSLAQSIGQGVKDVALTAGQFTIGKLAPLLGVDLSRARLKPTGLNLVADVGMAQAGRPRYVGINNANPSLNAMLDREWQSMERAQAHSPSAWQPPGGKWEAAATIGIDYRFE